jgi:UDPglucose 6-dehydrogenase
VVRVNIEQFVRVADKVEAAVGGDLEGVVVAAWGLTFKAGTDDLRESPALEVIARLRERGASVRAYDPAIGAESVGGRPTLDGIEVVDDPYTAVDGASALVVLTEWDRFRSVDFEVIRDKMARAAMVDARNLLDRSELVRLGFSYVGIGRS